MKNKKLNLEDLKVRSFVTAFDNEKADTAKGGASFGELCSRVFCTIGEGNCGGSNGLICK